MERTCRLLQKAQHRCQNAVLFYAWLSDSWEYLTASCLGSTMYSWLQGATWEFLTISLPHLVYVGRWLVQKRLPLLLGRHRLSPQQPNQEYRPSESFFTHALIMVEGPAAGNVYLQAWGKRACICLLSHTPHDRQSLADRKEFMIFSWQGGVTTASTKRCRYHCVVGPCRYERGFYYGAGQGVGA